MSDKINGRTPDEIKKGLECCIIDDCAGCPYEDNCFSDDEGLCESMNADTLAYIQQLERERDAAVEYIKGDCDYCKHRAEKWLHTCEMNGFCKECCTHDYCKWQWCGVQKEVE